MKPFRLFTKLFITSVVVILLIFTYPYLLKPLGCYLTCEQIPRKADLIIVLNGRDTERSLAAVDLYKQGYANLIVIARLATQPGSDEFKRRVGDNFDGRTFFQRAVEAMGVPKTSLVIIGNGVTSTYDEAIAARDFLREKGYKTMILVTSKWHSRRAYLTFQSVFKNENVTMTFYPTKYDTFDPRTWWKSRTDVKSVFSEYGKLLYYVFVYRVNPIT